MSVRKDIEINASSETLSLVTGIAYSMAPHWYDHTYVNLTMNLLLPKHIAGHAKQPCLLFLCGGAYSVVDNAVWMPELMYFARRGYTVATINYRTSNSAPFPAQLIDAKAAVRFLKAHSEQFCIDPNRIAIAGESAGGTLSALVGTTAGMREYERGDFLEYDSSVAAVVDYYGPVDLRAIVSPVSNHRQEEQVADWTIPAFLGADASGETARQASAICHVSADTPPFIILHGTEDPLVDIVSQSDRLYDVLLEKGVYTEYYRFLGAGHGEDVFYQPEAKQLVLCFLNRVLGVNQ